MLKKKVFVFFMCLLFCSFLAVAQTTATRDYNFVISNSDDWRDVYSTMFFATLEGLNAEFLVSTAHGPLLLNGISTSYDVFVVTSEDDPLVFNYPSMITSRGFNSVDEIRVENANIELLDELPDIDSFIVVGDDYGYNAIAVLPYARETRSWVFLASRENIDDINVALSNRNVNDLLIYGYVDREVRETLALYDPDVISTSDKFKDNIEIVERTLEVAPSDQVILTNGEFIEKEIMAASNPILFTGRENVPDQIRDYLKTSDIKIGVLVGNELINAATNIKRTAGIDVIAKFARSSRSSTAGIATVEGLDLFYLPSPRLELEIYSVKYNRATGRLEVTYRSNSNVPAYFMGTITLLVNGQEVRVGDLDPVFIAPGDFKTVVYEDVDFDEDNAQVSVYTLYGEIESALDRVLQGNYDVDIVNVIDSCDLEIDAVIYNLQKDMFFVRMKNVGDTNCYASVEMRDVVINEIETTIGSEEPALIKAGKSAYVYVDEQMDPEDLADNDLISVYVYYGERADSLVNVVKGNFEIIIQRFTRLTWIIIILVIIILILLLIAFLLRRKEDEWN